MARGTWTKWLACAVCGVGTVGAAMAQEDVLIPTEEPVPYHVGPLSLRVTGNKDVLYFVADEKKAAEASDGEYWLGVQIAMLPEVAKQQLGIEQGLVIEDVAPDSPAAKAELKKHDILIKADETPLKEPTDLIKSVEASKGKEMTVRILRGGKDRTVKVVAAKRPEKERVETRTARPQIDAEIKRLEQALEALKSKAGKESFGLFLARPAVVRPNPKAQYEYRVSPFQEKDWSIQFTKEGDSPAKIHIKRGDKEWDVTEDKLDELPNDVRGHVLALMERTLMRGGTTRNIIRVNPQGKIEGEVNIAPFPPKPPMPPMPPVAPAAPQARTFTYRAERADNSSDAKLDALMNEVKQLRKEVEELRGKSPGDKK